MEITDTCPANLPNGTLWYQSYVGSCRCCATSTPTGSCFYALRLTQTQRTDGTCEENASVAFTGCTTIGSYRYVFLQTDTSAVSCQQGGTLEQQAAPTQPVKICCE